MDRICTFLAAGFMYGCLSLTAHGQQPAPGSVSVLTVTKLCCGKESKPAIAALLKIRGVQQVTPDHKAHTLTITAQRDSSPRALWESIEQLKLGPTRLVSTEGTWTTKPSR